MGTNPRRTRQLAKIQMGLSIPRTEYPRIIFLSLDDGRGEIPPVEDLTPRELQVLQLLAEGLSNKTIADRLSISEHTVKFHVAAILGKLEAHTRTEAVTRAIREGLIIL
jgi:DNA-binding NarL/FixJ family response regulator